MPSRPQDADSGDRASANIARHLRVMAEAQPRRVALKIPRGRRRAGEIDYLALDFAALDAEAAAWGEKLSGAGIAPGDRTLVMVRQGLPLIAAVFALFRLGAVPVVIDPGMGLKSFLACVARSRPRALVGIPFAQVVSRLFRKSFGSVGIRVSASGSLTARLAKPQAPNPRLQAEVRSGSTDLAAILFTSGSTGAPKGVCYEHGMFDAQVRLIREAYAIEPGEVDLPMLPIFALFNPALGMTTIVPEIDPQRPAEVDAAKVVQAIRQEGVTNSFGSPTLWNKILAHCHAHGLQLPSLRRVLCAGAPVPAKLWQRSRTVLTSGRLHSPYGATEALPVATISSDEVETDSVRGACVGRPLPEIEVRVIAITDTPLATIADARECLQGEIGELIVRGPVVTRTYDALADATNAAKIVDASSTSPSAEAQTPNAKLLSDSSLATRHSPLGISGAAPASPVWHRMGDCGYLDENGRLWFCGRKAERVETAAGTLHTEPCEQVFRSHALAARCALIGLGVRGQQRSALVIEGRPANSSAARRLARELRELALRHPHTASIKLFYFHPKFPVDVRHNAKIHRLTLAQWAVTAKGFEVDPKR